VATSNTKPKAGDLRHRIAVGRTATATNENGYPMETDTVICRLWASARDAGYKEFFEAASSNLEDVINFSIRYRPDVEPGMWVEFESQRREIVQVNGFDHLHDFLLLKTARRKAVSG
jgi:SPP1 family predicted phage head-tail adaptor